MRNDCFESLLEVCVELKEVVFKSLLLLLVQLYKQVVDTLFSLLLLICLSLEVHVLLVVLLVPLLTVSILSWELVEFLAHLLDQSFQFLVRWLFRVKTGEDYLIKSAKSSY